MPWSLDTCSTQCSPDRRMQLHGASNRDTHLYPPQNIKSVFLTATTYVRRIGRITNGTLSGRTAHKTPYSISRHRCTHTRNDPPKNSLGSDQPPLHQCRSFPLLPVYWGMSYSVACECGAEQIVDHVVLHCPIHRPPRTTRPDGSGR